MTKTEIGQAEIVELLELKGWSRAELASRLNLTEFAVLNWVKQGRKPNGTSSMLMRQWLEEARAAKPPSPATA